MDAIEFAAAVCRLYEEVKETLGFTIPKPIRDNWEEKEGKPADYYRASEEFQYEYVSAMYTRLYDLIDIVEILDVRDDGLRDVLVNATETVVCSLEKFAGRDLQNQSSASSA